MWLLKKYNGDKNENVHWKKGMCCPCNCSSKRNKYVLIYKKWWCNGWLQMHALINYIKPHNEAPVCCFVMKLGTKGKDYMRLHEGKFEDTLTRFCQTNQYLALGIFKGNNPQTSLPHTVSHNFVLKRNLIVSIM